MADYSVLWQGAPQVNALAAIQGGQQVRQQNQLFEQQQADQARAQQFNTLLGEYLGQGTVNTLGSGEGMQFTLPDGTPMAAGRQVSANELFALDPARAAQALQFQRQQAQDAQAAEQAAAQSAVRKAQFVLDSKNPGALVRAAYPDIWQQLLDNGDDPESFTPEKWREEASQMLAYYGPAAGVAPSSEESPFAKINPADFTPESVAKFEVSGQHGDLVAREKPGDDPNDKQFTRASSYRKEYLSRVDGFEGIRSAYENVKSSTDNDAGDTQLITNFLRVIAPGVRVQPGQQLDAAQLPSGMQTAAATWNKFVNDGKLSKTDRANIREQAKITFDTQKKIAAAERERYTKLAKLSGLDPWEVVGDDAPGADASAIDFSQMSDEELRRIAAGG